MAINPARALTALQAALKTAFKADATLTGLVQGRIHDGSPKADVTPWLAFADGTADDWSTGDGPGARVTLVLEAEGSDAERPRTLAVLDAAATVVEGASLTLSAGKLVLLRTITATVDRVDGGRRWRGRLTLEALVDG